MIIFLSYYYMSKGQGFGQAKHFFKQFDLEKAGLPSNVKELLSKVNDYEVQSITIGRNSVQSVIQTALRTLSQVKFDNIFHLFLVFNCTNGKKVLLEKNARINMSMTIPKMEDSMLITNVPHYTIKEYIARTKQFMGQNFIPYDPDKNNCQNFILSVFQANGIQEAHDFIKQDTSEIFKNKGWLSSTAKSVTNLGGIADVVLKGGLIKQMRAGNLSNELTDADIVNLAKQFKIPHFKGCFIRDETPKLKVGESCIINLNGASHWTALIHLPDGYFYFDSFGVIGPKILENIDYVYSEIDLQKLSSSACGFYCLAFLISMNRNGDGMKMYAQFVDAFKSPEDNDITLKKRFKL